MAPPLEVQTRFGGRIFGGLALVAVFTLPCLVSGIYGLTSGSTGKQIGMAFGMMVVNALVFGLVPGLLVYRRRISAQRFDEKGVTRFDGRLFPWSEFGTSQRTMKRMKYGGTVMWQVELQFASGSALVLLRLVKNEAEVMRAVEAIEAGKNPWG